MHTFRLDLVIFAVALAACISHADGADFFNGMKPVKLPAAQVAFGKLPTVACDPWMPLAPEAKEIATTLPRDAMLHLLATYLVPAERRLETPVQFGFVYLMHGSVWDAMAPFNTTAKPILKAAAVPRQPASKRTNAYMNTVIAFCLQTICKAHLPEAVPGLRKKMMSWKLNVDDMSRDINTAPGLGNYIADIWAKYGMDDGFNRPGDLDHTHNRRQQSDYYGFVSQNDAYTLRNISMWQPLLETNDLGYYFQQHHITPFLANATGFSLSKDYIAKTSIKGPYEGLTGDALMKRLKADTDKVLEVSAGLTDKQKIQAEFFDDKLVSLAPIPYYLATLNDWDTHTLLGATMAMSCVYDSTLLCWKEKVRHAAVRPISLVRHFYGENTVKAWGGSALGKTTDITGNDWLSYLRTMPHAEYPSGTSCVCAAYGEFMKRFLKADKFDPEVIVSYKKGCSRRETGKTPSADMDITLSKIDEMIALCGKSRHYAGVHFEASIKAGIELCGAVGAKCYDKYKSLI